MRLGVLTGGGDCPGLNAVLRSVVRRGILENGHEFVGILNGYQGLVEDNLTQPLTLAEVRGILPQGGTIIGTSNKANPFQYSVKDEVTGLRVDRDLSDVAVQKFHALGLQGLIAIGGDGTLSIAHRLGEKGIPVIGCPKTIDNDLSGTDQTFGFDTAVGIISEAIDRLHSTAEAHARVMIVEIMGRDAGFLTLDGGLAGGADVILIPEIPYQVEAVVAKIKSRWSQIRPFSIIAISEGAFPLGGEQAVLSQAKDIPGRGVVRLGGSGNALAHLLAPHIEAEIRVTVLGHLQRGGSPSAQDRVLATLYGAKVIDLVNAGQWNHMVALSGGQIAAVPLAVTRKEKKVDPLGDKVRFAKAIGISFGSTLTF